MDDATLARRRPVWEALSGLFVDTETRWSLPRLAGVLVDSGYSEAELEWIFWREVVPEYGTNLLSVAGVWSAFASREPFLIARARGRFSMSATLLRWLVTPLVRGEWRAVLALRKMLRLIAPELRERWIRVWHAFALTYLETSLGEGTFIEPQLQALRTSGFSTEELEQALDETFAPIYRTLLDGSEDPGAHAANVRQLIALLQQRSS